MDSQRFLPLFTVALATGAPMVHGCTITIPAGLLPGTGTPVVTSATPTPKPTGTPQIISNPVGPVATPTPTPKPKGTPPMPISNPMVPVVPNPTRTPSLPTSNPMVPVVPNATPTPPLPISNPMVPVVPNATPTPPMPISNPMVPVATPTPTPAPVFMNGFLPQAPLG